MIKVIQSLPNTGKSACIEMIEKDNALNLVLIDTDNFIYDYHDGSSLDEVLHDISESLEDINNKNIIIFTNLHLLHNNVIKKNVDISDNKASYVYDVEYIICVPFLNGDFGRQFFDTKNKEFSADTLRLWYFDYINKYCFCSYLHKFNKYLLTDFLSNCFSDFIFGGNYVK